MAKARTLVGLDVHAAKIVAAVLDAETGALQRFRVSGDVGEAAALCGGLPRPVRATYEAGPTGYGLARELERRGVACLVAAQATLLDAIGAVDALVYRRDRLERAIVARVPDSPSATDVGRLRCLRGVDTLTAAGLCAEIGDFERFARTQQPMHYVGLVPSEDSTGEQRRLGAITKTGSGHARF